jgi:hypothetical protein
MPYKAPEKRKEYAAKYNLKNRQKIRAYMREYHEKNKNAEWLIEYRKKYYNDNKDEIKERSSSRYSKNREKIIAYQAKRMKLPEVRARQNGYVRRHRVRCRQLCIEHYSNGKMKCANCPEKRYNSLTIDHIHGGGKRHRESISRHLPEWLVRHNFPEGYRILCWNCNCSPK